MKKIALILAILALSFASLIGGPTWLAHELAGGTKPAATVAPPVFSVFNFSFYIVTSIEQFGPRLDRSPGLAAGGFALALAGPVVGLGVI